MLVINCILLTDLNLDGLPAGPVFYKKSPLQTHEGTLTSKGSFSGLVSRARDRWQPFTGQ
jgi:hypothetical protein